MLLLTLMSQLKPPQFQLVEKLGMMLIHESSSFEEAEGDDDIDMTWNEAESKGLDKLLRSKRPFNRSLSEMAKLHLHLDIPKKKNDEFLDSVEKLFPERYRLPLDESFGAVMSERHISKTGTPLAAKSMINR